MIRKNTRAQCPRATCQPLTSCAARVEVAETFPDSYLIVSFTARRIVVDKLTHDVLDVRRRKRQLCAVTILAISFRRGDFVRKQHNAHLWLTQRPLVVYTTPTCG